MSAHPPPPWRLRGRAALVAVPVRAAAAPRAGLPPGARLLTAGPWTLGGLVLADYDAGATLAYRELVVLCGLVVVGGRPAFAVSHIYVDSEASRRGGREIWALPKELARFAATAEGVDVRRPDGAAIATLAVAGRGRRAVLPLWAPVVGTLGARTARTAGRGRMRAAVGVARVGVPPESPLAALGLCGRRPAVLGEDVELEFPAPLA